MTEKTVIYHDAQTGEVIEQQMTAEEIAIYEKDLLDRQELLAAKQKAKTEAEAKRTALLEKLGITEEEARLLLGGN